MTVFLRDSVFSVFTEVWVEWNPDDHACAGYKLGEHFALDYFFEVFTVYGYYHGLRILPRFTDTIKVFVSFRLFITMYFRPAL